MAKYTTVGDPTVESDYTPEVTMSVSGNPSLDDIAVEGFARFMYQGGLLTGCNDYLSDELHDPTWGEVLQCATDAINTVGDPDHSFLEDFYMEKEADDGVAIYMLHIGS